MIGWIAELTDGQVLREQAGWRWAEVDIYRVVRLWLDGHERHAWSRRTIPTLQEFIHFKTACLSWDGWIGDESAVVGWTDGHHEILYRVSCRTGHGSWERGPWVHFHPHGARGSVLVGSQLPASGTQGEAHRAGRL